MAGMGTARLQDRQAPEVERTGRACVDRPPGCVTCEMDSCPAPGRGSISRVDCQRGEWLRAISCLPAQQPTAYAVTRYTLSSPLRKMWEMSPHSGELPTRLWPNTQEVSSTHPCIEGCGYSFRFIPRRERSFDIEFDLPLYKCLWAHRNNFFTNALGH